MSDQTNRWQAQKSHKTHKKLAKTNQQFISQWARSVQPDAIPDPGPGNHAGNMDAIQADLQSMFDVEEACRAIFTKLTVAVEPECTGIVHSVSSC